MTYSTAYTIQLAQFISLGLALANIQIDAKSIETVLSVGAVIGFGLLNMYRRYKVGDITALGFHK